MHPTCLLLDETEIAAGQIERPSLQKHRSAGPRHSWPDAPKDEAGEGANEFSRLAGKEWGADRRGHQCAAGQCRASAPNTTTTGML